MTNLDAPPVETEEQALVLMLHHLELAAMYFEASPENLSKRLAVTDHFSFPAQKAWITAMEDLPQYKEGEF